MTCVLECDSVTQIRIEDPQLKSIPVCRDFEYYVNANSESLVEAGTQMHPYKDIESVFVEIMNFHSHSLRNIIVFVMEETTVFVNSVTYFVNITHIQIEAYSEKRNNEALARMVGLTNSSKIIPPATQTKFKLLENHVKLTDQMIFNNEGFDSDDRVSLLSQSAVFKPFHAGLIIKNFRVVTDYDDPATLHGIFEPYRVDRRTLGMINCDLRTQGSILATITTVFNWHMENIILETQHLYRFSLTRLRCGDDGTDMDTRVYFKNMTTINSGGKPPYLHAGVSFTRNYMANNIHFEDLHFDNYLGYTNKILQFVFYAEPMN